jgi:hypothetical protein
MSAGKQPPAEIAAIAGAAKGPVLEHWEGRCDARVVAYGVDIAAEDQRTVPSELAAVHPRIVACASKSHQLKMPWSHSGLSMAPK